MKQRAYGSKMQNTHVKGPLAPDKHSRAPKEQKNNKTPVLGGRWGCLRGAHGPGEWGSASFEPLTLIARVESLMWTAGSGHCDARRRCLSSSVLPPAAFRKAGSVLALRCHCVYCSRSLTWLGWHRRVDALSARALRLQRRRAAVLLGFCAALLNRWPNEALETRLFGLQPTSDLACNLQAPIGRAQAFRTLALVI